mgnify:CR=1 FL=1
MKRLLSNSTGIGLIEVLISTVVVAIGLLAIASMQGDFLSASGDNKARAEAQSLAEKKTEEIKNLIEISGYTSISASSATETITGANETFKRIWGVVDNTTYKEITVTIYWDSNNTDTDKQVVLTTQVAFTNPTASIAIAQYGDGGSSNSYGQSPSPNQSSSESVESTIDLFESDGTTLKTGITTTSESNVYLYDGKKYRDNGTGLGFEVDDCTNLVQFDLDLSYPGNYPVTYDGTASPAFTPDTTTGSDIGYLYTKRFTEDGLEVIQLYSRDYSSTTTGLTTSYTLLSTCQAEHRYFGGVIIPVTGEIHTEFTLDDIKVDHNKEDMFCAFYAGIGEVDRPYACYVGGNCTSSNGSATTATECSSSGTSRDITEDDGGFSGNIGLLDVDDNGAGKENVCFQGDLNGTATDFFTARKYKTMNAGTEQGINEPYNCQDFYIVGRQANVSRLSAKCSAEAGTVNLPPQEILRTLSGSNTVVTTTNVSYCTARIPYNYMLSVTISGGTATTVETATGTSCTLDPMSTDTYTCNETTSSSSIIVYASNSSTSGSYIFSNLSGGSTPSAGSITLSAPPSYTFSGTFDPALNGGYNSSHMTITADSYIGFPSIIYCTNNFSSTSFECTIQTFESSVRMEVRKASASASCNANGLDGSQLTFTNICTLDP